MSRSDGRRDALRRQAPICSRPTTRWSRCPRRENASLISRANYDRAVFLSDFVGAFAAGIALADADRPVALNKRSGAPYLPGIGPHTESETVTLALASLPRGALPSMTREVPYPAMPQARCDLVAEEPEAWAIEVKMHRLMGDNGKPNDNMLLHLLSPYPSHRSAVTDCSKLASSGFPHRKAIVIFGYEHDGWPMAPAIDAFECLASRTLELVPAAAAPFSGLVHPVHQRGHVFGWEIVP